MATTSDLHTSISALPHSEAMDLIHQVRARRRVPIKKPKKPTAKMQRKANRKSGRPQDAMASVKGMTKEAKADLAKTLLESLLK